MVKSLAIFFLLILGIFFVECQYLYLQNRTDVEEAVGKLHESCKTKKYQADAQVQELIDVTSNMVELSAVKCMQTEIEACQRSGCSEDHLVKRKVRCLCTDPQLTVGRRQFYISRELYRRTTHST